jgi:F-type H+-transporting ATPase subunit b
MNMNMTLLGQTLSFFLFVWFCKKFVWPPMIAAMQARQEQIADGLAAAQKGQQAQEVAEQEAAQLISDAKAQASEIISNAEKRGHSVVDEAKQTASNEKERIVASAQAEVEQSVHSAREALRGQVSSIAIAAANKIVDKEIDEKTHAVLLDDLVKQLKAS